MTGAAVRLGGILGGSACRDTMADMSASSIVLRPALATMPAYVPGRTVPGAIKLASNESPAPLLPEVQARVAEAVTAGNRYPDTASMALREVLAGRFGVAIEQIAVGCGSVALCQQVIQAVADAGDEVLYPWRSFEAYPILTAVCGARSVQVALRDDQSFDLDAVLAAVTDRTRVIFVCTPNNPTGTALSASELRGFLDRVPDTVLVVVDEAYVEYNDTPDLAPAAALLERRNVVLLRTFSKAYGLAGLRVGYAVAADAAVAQALRQTGLPFAVSVSAQAAALASLQPDVEAQLLARVADTIAERQRVYGELSRLGYPVVASRANFLWLALGSATVQWAQACQDGGVIVRPFADAGARVTVSSASDNDRFLEVAGALSSTVGADLSPSSPDLSPTRTTQR